MNRRKRSGEKLPLAKAAEHLLEECRMVLPGLQALLGFQLIVVFNPGFADTLEHSEQILHVGAIVLVAIAIALIMTPAAYHRQTCPLKVTPTFIALSTRLLLWSMWPMAISICAELYLIGKQVMGNIVAAALMTFVAMAFAVLWFVLPHWRRLRRFLAGGEVQRERE